MLIAYLVLRPAERRLRELVEYYRIERVVEGGLAHGLIRGELVLPREEPTDVGVISLWGSLEDYRSWQGARERERLVAGMAPLLAGPDAISNWTREVPADDVRPDRSVDVTELYGTRVVDRPIVVVADEGKPA